MTDRAKIWWEARRIGRQVSSALIGRWRTPYYDAVLARRIRRSSGDLSPGPKRAIYLIYPTGGVLESHLAALRAMVGHGYAPTVVSNLPLSAQDHDRLRPLAADVLERPNFGYDFGGYRDGVLHLAPRLSAISHLLLMNDSVWGPVQGDWIAEAEAIRAGFVGATTHFGVDWRRLDDLSGFTWRHDIARPSFHYASYALLMGADLIHRADFLRLWTRMMLSQDKTDVVRHGEIGLTRYMLTTGVSHAATVDVAGLDRALAALSDEELAWTAELLVTFNDRHTADTYARGLDAASDRDTVLRLMLAAVARQGIGYALPHWLMATGRLRFVKKAPASSQPSAIVRSLHLVWLLGDTVPGHVADELHGLVRAWLARQADGPAAGDVREALARAETGMPPLWSGSATLRCPAWASLIERSDRAGPAIRSGDG